MIQFFSHVLPSSGENSCSQRAPVSVMFDHVNRTPLSTYFAGPGPSVNALVLGFAAVRPEAARRGMERLAAAIEAARRH